MSNFRYIEFVGKLSEFKRKERVAGVLGFKRSRDCVMSGCPRRITTALLPEQLQGEMDSTAAASPTLPLVLGSFTQVTTVQRPEHR